MNKKRVGRRRFVARREPSGDSRKNETEKE